MHRVTSRVVATLLVLLAGSARAHPGATCESSRCSDTTMIGSVRAQVASSCSCAAAENPKAYMRCVRQVLGSALTEGHMPRSCKTTIAHCEAELGCGRGYRPFASVQSVFKTSCALPSCHSTLSRQGDLVLESEDVSYASLVSQPATQPEAHAAGMLRVKPGDPKDSFLVRKLRGEGPGDAMPQASEPLPRSTIKVIEKWIKRGARTTAEECPPSNRNDGRRGSGKLCNDRPVVSGNYVWHPQPPLDPPAPGTGIQLYAPPRDVAPGTEWETCYVVRPDWPALAAAAGYPPGQLPVIRRQTYRMHDGSHHLLLYAYFGQHPEQWADGYFPCSAANCINASDCPTDSGGFATIPIGGTQVAGTRYEVDYPEGVGIPVLTPNSVLIINEHYTNPFQPPQPIYGEAWLNLDFYAPGEFKVLLDGIFAINFSDLLVEPFETRTISRVWQPRGLLTRQPADAAVFQLFGHMHKRGQSFQIDVVRGGSCSGDGGACGRDEDCACKPWESNCAPGQTCVRGPGAEDTEIYYTDHWDRAPVLDFTKPYLLINRNEGLRWTCVHTNGVAGDPTRPPKKCSAGCRACGWDAPSGTCHFCPTLANPGLDWSTADQACGYFEDDGFHPMAAATPRIFQADEPMPLVFGELADDDMCNMFGYFINQQSLPLLP